MSLRIIQIKERKYKAAYLLLELEYIRLQNKQQKQASCNRIGQLVNC